VTPRIHRTLFVGNSQIRWHDLPRLVSELTPRRAAPPLVPHIRGEPFVRSGASLHQLLHQGAEDGRTLLDTFASGAYDAVVIAESFRLIDRPDDGYPAKFIEDATAIVAAARAANTASGATRRARSARKRPRCSSARRGRSTSSRCHRIARRTPAHRVARSPRPNCNMATDHCGKGAGLS
jgi:hypothetical protein